jgi:hypothetical protein
MLGYIVIGKSTGRWGIAEKKRITGWQLMSFIEYLENKNKDEKEERKDKNEK